MAHTHTWEKSYTLKTKDGTDLTEICRPCQEFRTRPLKEEKPKAKKSIAFKQSDYR